MVLGLCSPGFAYLNCTGMLLSSWNVELARLSAEPDQVEEASAVIQSIEDLVWPTAGSNCRVRWSPIKIECDPQYVTVHLEPQLLHRSPIDTKHTVQ